jgi:acetyl-CoA acyltransferase
MSKQIQDAYIVSAVRTPVGKAPRGTLRHARPDDLLSHCLRTMLEKTPQLDLNHISDVIIGCAMPEAEQGMNVARIALLLAGMPNTVPGLTINRFCSSGLQAIAMAADRIRLGEAQLMIAGGTESMSMVPIGGHSPSYNPAIFSNDYIGIAYGMGITAEKVATQWKIQRDQQDAFSLQSHQRALAAQDRGDFATEIAPYRHERITPHLSSGQLEKASQTFSLDEGPRRDTSLESLAKLKPAFAARGSVTAGNSSQMSDGAATLLLASEQAMKHHNLTPLARFVSYSVAGVPPEIMGIGPKEAIPQALRAGNLKLSDIDWIELNEAFAAQSLAVIQELQLDSTKVNPLGGAIALGHPLGATGAIRSATLLHGMKRQKLKYGMVTMCIGTGMGAAGIFEAV